MNALSFNTIATATALAAACAVLSVIVVLRRWAFIGEGISHSGFGGAGTAWLLMLAFPSLDQPWAPSLAVVIFCVATALIIGALTRNRNIHADSIIGIFLTASLAWGFVAQQVFSHVRHTTPALFENLLFGRMIAFSPAYTSLALATCVATICIVAGLWKEIVAYTFDPMLAETSGVRAGFIHYLLMCLLAIVIVIGIRIAGSVLMTALLILPGASALLILRRLQWVVAASIVIALLGTAGGLLLHHRWNFLPVGPAIVLIMFAEFVCISLFARSR